MANQTPQSNTLRGHYAGIVSRSMALIIDVLIIAIVLVFTNLLYQQIVGIGNALFKGFYLQRLIEKIGYGVIAVVVAVAIYTLYFTIFWGLFGKTPGGIVLGFRVVDGRGKRPSYFRAFIRFLIEFGIPLSLFLGGLLILLHPKRRALWDLLAGTYVIYDWDARPEEKFLQLMQKGVAEADAFYPPEQ